MLKNQIEICKEILTIVNEMATEAIERMENNNNNLVKELDI